jgi:protein phosphatase
MADVKMLVSARTDVGRARTTNEDAFAVTDLASGERIQTTHGDRAVDVQERGILLALSDGMGGHQAGEVASETAIAALLDGLRRGEPIDDAITGANDAVFSKAAEDLSLRGMGTTITAGVVDGRALHIGHVGDSRAYLLRDGELRQLTTDHSVIAELIAAGELTEAEALVDPRRAMITRALGIDAAVAVDVLAVDLADGDRLLLCSDGLTTMVRDDDIGRILATATTLEDAADALIDAANTAGGADNITVVVADVVADDTAAVDATPPEGVPEVSADAAATGSFDDTEQVPAVAADADAGFDADGEVRSDSDDDPGPVVDAADADDDADDDAGSDAELEELRHAVEETVPRRRWWQRRPRS